MNHIPDPPIYLWFAFGAVVGSFLGAVIYRLPRKIPMSRPARSFCPHCLAKIAWYDNIPLISFLLLKGRSRCCQKRIDHVYFLVELSTASATAALALIHQQLETLLWFLLLFYLLLPAAIIDIRHFLIPNRLLAAIAIPAALLAASVGWPFLLMQLMSAIFALLLLTVTRLIANRMLGKESLGWGDIKLGTLLAFFLGFSGVLVSLFAAACLALLWVAMSFVFNNKKRISKIPLAPFWAAGVLVVILLAGLQSAFYWSLPYLLPFI